MGETLARIGESWGGYTVLEVLEASGFAERYRVRDSQGHTRLLDVLPVQHPTLISRLRSAGLQRVDHPNLLAVRDIVPVLRFPGVVCSDAAGVTLATWMKARPPLRDRLLVFEGIVSGVAELHANGITHGYLQPEVVLVETSAGSPFPRLALPGVASVVWAILKDGGTVSSSGASLGSATFQAPEHQKNPSKSDLRSDLYALGCLLYYLVAGHSPLRGLDPLASYETARSEAYTPLSQVVPDVLPELDALTRDLLRADPDRRPTAEAVLGRLDPILGTSSSARWVWAVVVGSVVVGILLAAAVLWGLG